MRDRPNWYTMRKKSPLKNYKDKIVSIHAGNLQALVTKMFKAKILKSLSIVQENFQINELDNLSIRKNRV